MSWVASLEILTPDGIWYTLSSVQPDRLAAARWLRNRTIVLHGKGIRYRSTKIWRFKDRPYDPGQFEFLRGNEACAREWQDGLWR